LALPAGNPFAGVQNGYYWSGTSDTNDAGGAWCVGMYSGRVYYSYKASGNYVWPVRGGQ
jgi:hypothetical protein